MSNNLELGKCIESEINLFSNKDIVVSEIFAFIKCLCEIDMSLAFSDKVVDSDLQSNIKGSIDEYHRSNLYNNISILPSILYEGLQSFCYPYFLTSNESKLSKIVSTSDMKEIEILLFDCCVVSLNRLHSHIVECINKPVKTKLFLTSQDGINVLKSDLDVILHETNRLEDKSIFALYSIFNKDNFLRQHTVAVRAITLCLTCDEDVETSVLHIKNWSDITE